MTDIPKKKVLEILKNVASRITLVLNEDMNSDQITIVCGRAAYREIANSGLTLHQSIDNKEVAK